MRLINQPHILLHLNSHVRILQKSEIQTETGMSHWLTAQLQRRHVRLEHIHQHAQRELRWMRWAFLILATIGVMGLLNTLTGQGCPHDSLYGSIQILVAGMMHWAISNSRCTQRRLHRFLRPGRIRPRTPQALIAAAIVHTQHLHALVSARLRATVACTQNLERHSLTWISVIAQRVLTNARTQRGAPHLALTPRLTPSPLRALGY